MKKLLVTGTDTNVGKTWVSCLIIRRFLEMQVRVGAYKPVCSGAVEVDGQLQWADINALMGATKSDDQNRVCPQRFRAAVAPNVAARMEGREVDERRLSTGVKAWRDRCDVVVVEGAGGLCCPISDLSTVADFAETILAPVVVVAANKLGVINHTLLTLEVAAQRELDVRAVILNDTTPSEKDESQPSNRRHLAQWVRDIPILHCQHNGQTIAGLDDVLSEITA